MRRQQRDVFLALPQRRQRQLDHIQPVIKVAPEPALVHHRSQILMRGCQDARTNRHRVVAAERAHLFFLQCAQQLGLKIERQLGNLIQKNRAAAGRHQKAIIRPMRTGEGALHMAKEFALDQRGR